MIPLRFIRKRHTLLFIALLMTVLSGFALPAAAADTALKKVSLIPIWSHQAQFAGYYVAREKGIYARHGLDLTIHNGGQGRSPEEYLKSGRADFAVLWLTSALQQHDEGNRVINLAQVVQKSSMMFIARKSSGIKNVSDLQNRRIGVWDADLNLPSRAFFNKYHLKMKVIPGVATVNLFLRGGVDVMAAMWYNEYHTILNSGINPDELNTFLLYDYGITFPEDGLYTLEKNYRRDPRLAESFAKASLEGWRYAFDHPDEALDIVIRYMKKENIPANRAHQKWMLSRMRDLVLPENGTGRMGQLKSTDYNAVGTEMLKNRVIRRAPPFAEFTGGADAR